MRLYQFKKTSMWYFSTGCSFTTQSSYASALLGIIILIVCLSTRLSHAWFVTKRKNILPIFWYHVKGNHSSFLTSTEVGGRCPLLPKICAQSDPPPSEMRRLWPISAYNISTVRASKKSSIMANRKSATRFPTRYRWRAYVAPNSPKANLSFLWIKF